MSAIPYPSKTNYLRVPDTATKKADQLKGFSTDEVAKVSHRPFDHSERNHTRIEHHPDAATRPWSSTADSRRGEVDAGYAAKLFLLTPRGLSIETAQGGNEVEIWATERDRLG